MRECGEKGRGRTILANSRGSHTTKLRPVEFHEMIGSRVGASTRSKVLERNGGTGLTISKGLGLGELLPSLGFMFKEEE